MATIGTLATLAAGYTFFESQKTKNVEDQKYGDSKDKIAELRGQLNQDLCNQGVADQLVELLERTDNGAEAAEVLQPVVDGCPPNERLLAKLAELYRDQGAVGAALQACEKLIAQSPKDARGYALRGSLRAQRSDPRAVEDFRQATELDPGNEDAARGLADAHESGIAPCLAAGVLDELLARRSVNDRSALRARSDRLRKDGGCPRVRLEGGSVVIPYENRGDVMVVRVKIDGRHEAAMIFDTGASSVAITRSLANRLNLDLSQARTFYVATASGVAMARSVRLESVALGSARVSQVRAAVVPSMGTDGDIEGLLGNSFLSQFKVQVDSQKGQIILSQND